MSCHPTTIFIFWYCPFLYIFIAERNVLLYSYYIFSSKPAGAGLLASACVAINHAVTLRLWGLSASQAAWGPRKNIWGCLGTLQAWPCSIFLLGTGTRRTTSISCHDPRFRPLFSPMPLGSLQTHLGQTARTLITWHITLWGTVSRARQCLGAVHQWQ